MKKRFLSRATALCLSVWMVFSFVGCSHAETNSTVESSEVKIITVEKEVYRSAEQKERVLVAHYEDRPEILLIEINNAVEELVNGLVLGASPDARVEVEETDTMVTLTRENGEYCEIDFVEDTICFSDFDRFNMKAISDNPHDMLGFPYKNEKGENVFIQRETSFYTPGYSILIELAERNIPLDIYEGKKYIPLQTFNDLFISPYGINITYNGKDLFLVIGSTLAPGLEEIYYHEEKTPVSEALAEFNFNELCLYLDLYYGLKVEHGFENGFAYYLENIGLKEQFLSSDAIHSFNALATMMMGYMTDFHSSVVGGSPYLGEANPSEGLNISIAPSVIDRVENTEKFQQARAEQLGEVQLYEKIGNTAYVTLDEFSVGDRNRGYDKETLQIADTFTMIMLAHEQITQDAEIENVVVDLSCNGGGAVDSCAYLVAWMLGSCEFSVYNSITESRAITSYSADVNMDGKFDSDDTITDKNLYCIVSPISFSCGNYAAALLKASGNVTIVGKTSSGGGCVVRHGTTADGTLFTISDAKQMSIVKNGSYYGVDQGVEPDISLSKVESFYDRVALTEYLNGLK